MMQRWIVLAVAVVLVGCSGGGAKSDNTGAGNDTGTAQNALGGVGSGPAPKGAGGVKNPGDASGDNPQGEVSPSGPGGGNSTG